MIHFNKLIQKVIHSNSLEFSKSFESSIHLLSNSALFSNNYI